MSALSDAPIPVGTVPTETFQDAVERKKEEQVHDYANARLKSLVKSDEMYEALEYFLLLDPDRQIGQLGDTETLLAKGDKAKSDNQFIFARTNYEAAAKIEIYKGNKDAARECLLKALDVLEENDEKRRGLMTTLIDNIDEAIEVAKSYYGIVKNEILPDSVGLESDKAPG